MTPTQKFYFTPFEMDPAGQTMDLVSYFAC